MSFAASHEKKRSVRSVIGGMTPETLAWQVEGHGGGCDSHVWDHGRVVVIIIIQEYCNILKFWFCTTLSIL